MVTITKYIAWTALTLFNYKARCKDEYLTKKYFETKFFRITVITQRCNYLHLRNSTLKMFCLCTFYSVPFSNRKIFITFAREKNQLLRRNMLGVGENVVSQPGNGCYNFNVFLLLKHEFIFFILSENVTNVIIMLVCPIFCT